MTTLPQMSLVLPVRGAPGSGVWDDTLDADLALIDAHNHSTGQGTAVPTAGLNINADLTFGGLWAPIHLHRITFDSITAIGSNNKSLFVSDGTGGLTANELYWRSNGGTNVRLTLGNSLNIAAFVGGIGGDYSAVSAALNYDSSGLRYTFKGAAGTNWQRLASGEVRLFETNTAETVFVGLAAPAALAASYTVTWPLAVPGATSLVQMDTAGVLTASNTVANAVTLSAAATTAAITASGLITANAGVTAGANQHVTVSGTGEFKHGDRVKVLQGITGGCTGGPGVLLTTVAGGIGATGATTFVFSLDLHQGDRVKSVTFARIGDGAVDITAAIVATVAATAGGTTTDISGGGITVTNAAASWNDSTIDCTDTTMTAGLAAVLLVTANAAALTINNIRVTYDHP